MNSAAAMRPPMDVVYASHRRPSSALHTPSGPRAPMLVANDVTIAASTARAKSTTPRHCGAVRMALKPGGGAFGGGSSPAKYVLFAHVPLTRTYAGRNAP